MLERISLRFPGTHPEFHDCLLSLLADIGRTGTRLDLPVFGKQYFPRLSIAFDSADAVPAADFHLSGGEIVSIRIENTTGRKKRNPLPHRPIAVEEIARRLAAAGWKIAGADHIGFNLPWFGPDLHPRILELRAELAAASLYHEYPTGEPWDFILPGDADEIAGRKPVDYSIARRPKFELVSFDRSSTPLIQIDLGVHTRFEAASSAFPEAMADPAFRNIWLYTDNPYRVDVCLVLNECAEADWSKFFAGHRLPAKTGKSRQ